MAKSLVCLSLTGSTLSEDLKLVEKYNRCVDLVELRVDCLNEDEQLGIRRFPSLINLPCILTIRRKSDGGKFDSSEFSRTALFGRALAFASRDPSKNFAYVDFEENFHIPGLQDAAMAFGVKIIRSYYDFEKPVLNIRQKCSEMRKTVYEIPKVCFRANSISDVTRLFKESKDFTEMEHIVVAAGKYGIPSRILASRLNSYLTYVTPREVDVSEEPQGHIDPVTMNDMYNFRNIDDETEIYGVAGNPLERESNILIQNAGFRSHSMNKVFIPVLSENAAGAVEFAEQIGMKGLTVTHPFKTEIMKNIETVDSEAGEIGVCDTIVSEHNQWLGYNTDADAFKKAFLDFIADTKFKHKKVAVLGAGSEAHAVCYVLKELGAKVCIFNRTVSKAKELAERFGFLYEGLSPECAPLLDRYSDVIINTTSVGLFAEGNAENNNPIWFYNFHGEEMVMDLVFEPDETPLLKLAKGAGCKIINGLFMYKNQGYKQFKYFTGVNYEGTFSE